MKLREKDKLSKNPLIQLRNSCQLQIWEYRWCFGIPQMCHPLSVVEPVSGVHNSGFHREKQSGHVTEFGLSWRSAALYFFIRPSHRVTQPWEALVVFYFILLKMFSESHRAPRSPGDFFGLYLLYKIEAVKDGRKWMQKEMS